jgi:hypothetical protein
MEILAVADPTNNILREILAELRALRRELQDVRDIVLTPQVELDRKFDLVESRRAGRNTDAD